MKLRKFNQWVKLREAGDPTHQMDDNGDTPLAHATGGPATTGNPGTPGDKGVVPGDIEGLRKMVATRMEKFLEELEGYHMPKQMAVQVIAQVANALMQHTHMTMTQAKAGLNQAAQQQQQQF